MSVSSGIPAASNGGISVNARVITLDRRTFLDPSGEPALLPRTGTGSFDELVAMVSTDIRPRTLLDEWIRRDIVSIVEINTTHQLHR